MSRWDALLDACHKRARTIVMTTIAMGAGMLPIALGIVVDPSFRGKYSGQTVKVEGEELLVMREEDVMGVLE